MIFKKLQPLKCSQLLRNSWSRTSCHIRTLNLQLVHLKMKTQKSRKGGTFVGAMKSATSWKKDEQALCMQGLVARMDLSLLISNASPWRMAFMANKGPSVPQIIKLLDWHDGTDQYIMILESPIPCVDLLRFVELHGGSSTLNLLINQDTMEVRLIDFGCGALITDFAYALGFVLFEMVCGHYPTGDDLRMISESTWSRPGLSQECCQMICASLQPDPQQRLSLEEMHLHEWFKVME
ncbi:serine threonine- kinase pim-2-like protein [Labeo rohita]|uniref:non-specific serine/threonine protein kinase n=1 Tax=Labeo rohita TaxID=84645 RepID=A0A498L516_LABRO|nr:serine threonine- kinase pim-2-like protein [Labeo rohita]RXN16148.1 serine threonine- kinase pim-2-like protein [Labeo rohita]